MMIRVRAASTFAAGALLAFSACGDREARWRFTPGGIPRTHRVVQAAALLPDTLAATLFETKGRARVALFSVDGVQHEVELPETTGADALAADAARGTFYVGTSSRAAVFEVDPRARTARELAALRPLLDAERYVWALAIDTARDRLYAGTYPGGKLLEYDRRTKAAREITLAAPGRQYLRRIVVGRSGRLYCSLASPGAVVAVEPGRGPRLVLETEETNAPPLRVADGRVWARVGTREVAVGTETAEVSQPAAEFSVDDGGRLSASAGAQAREVTIDLAPRQDGMGIISLAEGPEGAVYGGTYYNASLFRIDAGTAAVHVLGRVPDAVGEFRVMRAVAPDLLVMPGYDARVWVLATRRPVERGNPAPRAEIGHGQFLANGIDALPGGHLLAISTPPAYGRQGGAVSVLDTRTWETWVDAELAGSHAVTSVCFGPRGRVYAGTSTEAGPGAPAATGPARFLVIDPAARRVVLDHAVVPSVSAVTAVAPVGEHHVVFGTDAGALHAYDGRTDAVREIARVGNVRDLRYWGEEGVVIGVAWKRGVFLVDGALRVTWVPGAPERLYPGIALTANAAFLHDGVRPWKMERAP
jgi:hypothetical protein